MVDFEQESEKRSDRLGKRPLTAKEIADLPRRVDVLPTLDGRPEDEILLSGDNGALPREQR